MAEQKFMDPAKLRTSQALRKRVEAYLKSATDLTPEQAEAVRRYALGELPFRAHTQNDAIIRSDFASDIARHVYNIRPWTADEARTYKASPPGAVGTAPISFKGADGKEFLIPEYGKPGSFKADVASWLRAGSKYHDPESTWNSVAQADRDAFLKEYEDEVKAADSAVKMMDPKSLGDPAYGGAAPAGVDAGPPPMQLIGMPPSHGGASGRFPRAQESPQERMRRRFEEELSQLSEADQAMRRGVAPGGVRFDNVAGIPTPRVALSDDQRRQFVDWVGQTFGEEKASKAAEGFSRGARKAGPDGLMAAEMGENESVKRLLRLRKQAAEERIDRGATPLGVGKRSAISDMLAHKTGADPDQMAFDLIRDKAPAPSPDWVANNWDENAESLAGDDEKALGVMRKDAESESARKAMEAVGQGLWASWGNPGVVAGAARADAEPSLSPQRPPAVAGWAANQAKLNQARGLRGEPPLPGGDGGGGGLAGALPKPNFGPGGDMVRWTDEYGRDQQDWRANAEADPAHPYNVWMRPDANGAFPQGVGEDLFTPRPDVYRNGDDKKPKPAPDLAGTMPPPQSQFRIRPDNAVTFGMGGQQGRMPNATKRPMGPVEQIGSGDLMFDSEEQMQGVGPLGAGLPIIVGGGGALAPIMGLAPDATSGSIRAAGARMAGPGGGGLPFGLEVGGRGFWPGR